MKNKKKIWTAGVLCASMLAGMTAVPVSVQADAVGTVTAAAEGTTCVSLGADLTEEQRAEVLSLLGLTEEDLSSDTVVTITNEEEHQVLDDYLDASVIGDNSYSSSRLTAEKDGYGIQVQTKNITYCTSEMYQNALTTAGVKNADVTVAAPFAVTGTAALVGLTEAYSKMTGQALQAENVSTAADELVTTGKISDELQDPLKATELIAAVKGAVADLQSQSASEAEDSTSASSSSSGTQATSTGSGISDEKLDALIDEACQKLGITLTDEGKQEIKDLMIKFEGLNLDSDTLKSQASDLYDKLKEKGIDIGLNKTDSMTIFDLLLDFIKQFQKLLRGGN